MLLILKLNKLDYNSDEYIHDYNAVADYILTFCLAFWFSSLQYFSFLSSCCWSDSVSLSFARTNFFSLSTSSLNPLSLSAVFLISWFNDISFCWFASRSWSMHCCNVLISLPSISSIFLNSIWCFSLSSCTSVSWSLIAEANCPLNLSNSWMRRTKPKGLFQLHDGSSKKIGRLKFPYLLHLSFFLP